MQTLPSELLILIAQNLKYEDYLDFRRVSKKVKNAIEPLLYDKRMQYWNYFRIAIIKSDIHFLNYLKNKIDIGSKLCGEFLEGKIPLTVYNWLINHNIVLDYTVLRDNDLYEYIKRKNILIDNRDFYNLMAGRRSTAIRYILENRLFSEHPKYLTFEYFLIFSKYCDVKKEDVIYRI